jgi:phosphoribosylformylglycinamidine (FGAM) synthase-like enzyme
VRAEHRELFEKICQREQCPVAFVGVVSNDGKVILYDDWDKSTPVDLELEKVLGIRIFFEIYFSDKNVSNFSPREQILIKL